MVIKALTQHKRNALKAMNPVTKALIYWILFLQSCHFLSSETTKLAEYKVMVDNLIAKQANIAHAELPDTLIPGHKRKQETDQEEEKREVATKSKVQNSLPGGPNRQLPQTCPLLQHKLPSAR
eukprot:5417816-Ditylum_brightwellii.AAC.1